jgi:type IX secretion system PorP/SprF family membrane protein
MKIRLTIFALLLTNIVFAQVKHVDFYNYDPKLINPAFAGIVSEQDYQVQFGGAGFDYDGYPRTLFSAFSTRLNNINSGIGAMWSQSRIGSYTETNVAALYNYQFKLGDKKYLSVGTQLGLSHTNIDFAEIDIVDGVDDEPSSHLNFHGNFGIGFRVNKFYAGIATGNLIVSGDYFWPYNRYYSFYSMYEFQVASWLKFKPSLLLRTTFTDSPYLDVNAIVTIKDFLLLGTTSQIRNDNVYQKYNLGFDIAKKVQLVGTLYSGVNHRNPYSPDLNIELMLRLRIQNKPIQ